MPKILYCFSYQVITLWKEQRLKQSTQSGKSLSGTNKGLLALAGVSTAFTGVFGYAAWSTENRKVLSYLLSEFLNLFVAVFSMQTDFRFIEQIFL